MKSSKSSNAGLNHDVTAVSDTVAILPEKTVPAVVLALRESTHDFHRGVEKLTPFFRKDFDQPAYLRWLDLMQGFYDPIDHLVEESAFSSSTGWDYKPRRILIADDVQLLAHRNPAAPRDTSKVLGEMGRLSSVGEIAGMLYVVEGSALGGKVLLKVLERSAGVTAALGASFFAPHGELPHIRWAEYVQLLTTLSADPAFERHAVRGAVTTFKALHDWIVQEWRA